MKTHFTVLLALFVAISAYAHTAPPHAQIRRIWVHAHNMTDSVYFDHNMNNIRFYLTNEESIPVDSVEYRIFLKGVDDNWITPIEKDWHFYSDLNPGDYTFKAQCRYNDGAWGPEIIRDFTIKNPWWRTTPALLAYIIIISGITTYIVYLLRARIKIKNQLRLERKNQLFKNELVLHASREFRTPLIIIRSIIEKLKNENDRLSPTDIRHLRASSRSLMQMVEQLAGYGEPGHEDRQIQKEKSSEDTETPINTDTRAVIAVPDIHLGEVLKRDMQKSLEVVLSDGSDISSIIEEKAPDAIVLDTDLTEINAYTHLHKLKTDPATANIPVILISTFDNSRSLLRAIRSEADDYLAKPFSGEVLTAMVIKNIKVAREKTSKPQDYILDRKPVYENKSDKLFLAKLEKTVNSHLADNEFDVNALARTLEMSRVQLYNKLKELNGMTPVEYLRDRRLERAATLLRESDLSVKEVRDRVGMPDATNFHRRFKEKFGTSPAAYK